MKRSLYMPISIILQQQQEAADVAEDPPRGEPPVPEVEVEVERTSVLDSSPPPTTPAPTDTTGPSYKAQQSPEHINVSSRELAAVMDAVYALATTQYALGSSLLGYASSHRSSFRSTGISTTTRVRW